MPATAAQPAIAAQPPLPTATHRHPPPHVLPRVLQNPSSLALRWTFRRVPSGRPAPPAAPLRWAGRLDYQALCSCGAGHDFLHVLDFHRDGTMQPALFGCHFAWPCHAAMQDQKKAASRAGSVMLARPTALVHEGEPGGRCDRAPCVDAPATTDQVGGEQFNYVSVPQPAARRRTPHKRRLARSRTAHMDTCGHARTKSGRAGGRAVPHGQPHAWTGDTGTHARARTGTHTWSCGHALTPRALTPRACSTHTWHARAHTHTPPPGTPTLHASPRPLPPGATAAKGPAPHMMKDGSLPPVQHTSASLLFQSHALTLAAMTGKSFRAASLRWPRPTRVRAGRGARGVHARQAAAVNRAPVGQHTHARRGSERARSAVVCVCVCVYAWGAGRKGWWRSGNGKRHTRAHTNTPRANTWPRAHARTHAHVPHAHTAPRVHAHTHTTTRTPRPRPRQQPHASPWKTRRRARRRRRPAPVRRPGPSG